MWTLVFYAFCLTIAVYGQHTGDSCDVDGVNGTCIALKNCSPSIRGLKEGKKPTLCSFDHFDPIVCCIEDFSTLKLKSDVERLNSEEYKNSMCPPVVHKRKYNDGKAWRKCMYYQEITVFPCVPGLEGFHRMPNCSDRPKSLVVGGGGEDAGRMEFKHMALLGYGKDVESAEWLCGGSLISERFILTAGHCKSTDRLGTISFIVLGILKRSDDREKYWHVYGVKSITTHPEYKPPSKYHDIALVETDRQIQFNEYIVPACLHTGEELVDGAAQATGWGALGRGRENADVLQKVPLWKKPAENCSAQYPTHRHLKYGYDPITQMCYGDDGEIRDTCSGDSGGPLQVKTKDLYCMRIIIGVISFGKDCAEVGVPGVYTRVAYYVPWIESVVWP